MKATEDRALDDIASGLHRPRLGGVLGQGEVCS